MISCCLVLCAVAKQTSQSEQIICNEISRAVLVLLTMNADTAVAVRALALLLACAATGPCGRSSTGCAMSNSCSAAHQELSWVFEPRGQA
eukprot:357202-Chlamydomonas_euryale.AAC.3